MEDLIIIKQTTASVEEKLSSLLTHKTEVEERVSELEDMLAEQKENPTISKTDSEEL